MGYEIIVKEIGSDNNLLSYSLRVDGCQVSHTLFNQSNKEILKHIENTLNKDLIPIYKQATPGPTVI